MSNHIDARQFALKSHGQQKYGDRPYEVHLQHVYRILHQSLFSDDPILSQASWLHDVVEDTPVTVDEIRKLYGSSVADIVYRVTDEPGAHRKERKLKTYPKIRGHRGATIIKLCDRIANVEASQSAPEKWQMYVTEFPEFRLNLFVQGLADSLWRRLEHLLGSNLNTDWLFKFWWSDKHGLIRQRSNSELINHPEVIQNTNWVYGPAEVLDAVTGMGEDPYSCGEWADDIEISKAVELAEQLRVNLFSVNGD